MALFAVAAIHPMNETQAQAARLIPQITEIRTQALELEKTHEPALAKVLADQRDSARNLVHYLALRQTDVRQLQHDLSALGLSSLGRAEACVLNTLNTVGIALHRLAQLPVPPEMMAPAPVDADTGPMLLNNHSEALLGIASGKRTVRIMVTMPSEAATQPALVRDLLAAGMDVMRINCAHDGPEVWQAMIDNLRQAERELGRTCKVSIDLAGPKLRTGSIPPLTRLLQVKPQRNARGQVTQPAKVQFVASILRGEANTSLNVPISDELIQQAQVGDVFKLKDARDKRRRFRVVETHAAGCFAETDQTAYIETSTAISLKRAGNIVATGIVGELPELVESLLLKLGDALVVTKEGQQTAGKAPD